jgi:hypothetical protein
MAVKINCDTDAYDSEAELILHLEWQMTEIRLRNKKFEVDPFDEHFLQTYDEFAGIINEGHQISQSLAHSTEQLSER